MQPGIYIVMRRCAQRELMKCVHVTMNSEYTITMREDQFMCYIMLATVRYTNQSSHASKSDRSQVSDHCPDPTNVFGSTRYSIFTTRSVLYQDRSGRAYHQTEG